MQSKPNRSASAYGGSYGAPPSDSGNFDWREYYFAIKERLWLVLIITLVMTAYGFKTASTQIFKYSAHAILFLELDKSKVLDSKMTEVKDDQIRSVDMINTMVELLQSYPFALRVVNRLNLTQDNQFLWAAGLNSRTISPETAADRLVGMVRCNFRAGTRLVDITVTTSSGETSVKLANGYAEEYLHYLHDQQSEATRSASTFLLDESDRLRKKMRASDEGMQKFRERERAASLDIMQQEAQTQISECSARQHLMDAKLAQINTDIIAAKSAQGNRDELLKLPSINNMPKIAMLMAKIQTEQEQLYLVQQRYRQKHPAYVIIKTQLDIDNNDLKTLLLGVEALLESNRDSLLTEQLANKATREAAETRLLEVTSKSVEYNDLKRELQSDAALYDAVLARIKEVDITKEFAQSPVRIQELASGVSSVGKNPIDIILKNFFTGLGIGLGLVIFFHKIDSSFKTVDQTEKATGLSVVSAIPQIGGASSAFLGFLSKDQFFELLANLMECWEILFKSSDPFLKRVGKCIDILQPVLTWLGNPHRGVSLSKGKELVVQSERTGIVAEAFRTLRVSVAMHLHAENQRSFLFTSAIPSEGKSFNSANFSTSLAQQGLKTLLIDADLRKPSLSKIFFSMNRKPGVAEVLLGKDSLENAVNSTDIENLSLLTAGGLVENPSELLAGQPFRDLMAEALRQYDRVVIDSAPILAVSDTLLIATQVEVLCLVVRSFVTPKRMVKRALVSLKEVGVTPVGICLNCLPYGRGSYYYYTSGKYAGSYYGNGSVYGYGSSN
jgi:capsular exopolysaccharide synthesis family protein